MSRQPRTILGFLGDVNFPEYDGAVVYRQGGYVHMDIVEHFDDGTDKVAVTYAYDVPKADGWRSEWWARNLAKAAESCGQEVDELEADLDSKDPVARASVLYYTIKGYCGLEGDEEIVRARELGRLFAWTARSKKRRP